MSYLRKRGKKWYYTIEIGTGTDRRRIERAGGRTKAEAQAAFAAALAQYSTTGSVRTAAKITYRELAGEWESTSLKASRPMTRRNYDSTLRNHILPAFGERLLPSIRPRDLQSFLNQKAEVSSTAVLGIIRAVLKRTFDYAVFAEYLTDTPMRGVKTPEGKPLGERRTFTPEEFHQLTDYLQCQRPELLLPVLIAYHTGARCGEILALTWDDLDTAARTLTINKTLLQDGTLEDRTKTKSGTRTITIGAALLRILKAARAQQAQDRLRYGRYYRDCGRICRRIDGSTLTQPYVRTVNKYCRDHFAPGLCFHSLRHTHATMLLEAGEDLELVSKRLGHAAISTTAKVYSHILETRQNAEREIIDRTFL